MPLSSELQRVSRMMSEASSFQWNGMLMREDLLDRIEASGDQDLRDCTREIAAKFAAWTQPQDVTEPGALFEVYGEAVCLLELKARAEAKGCLVRRLSAQARARQGLKTPDIVCTGPDGDFYIEVKVLDMVGGAFAAKALAQTAFDNEVELRSRLKPGVNFGQPLEIQPLGQPTRERTHAEVLDIYVSKIANNIKKKQLTVGPTFLLLFDARIALDCYEPSCLVPVYFQEARFRSPGYEGECVSGDFWQIGFGQIGEQVLGHSEFEGKGNLEGRRKANGILVDHPYLLGLSVLTSKLSEPALKLHTLAQTERSGLPQSECFDGFDAADTAYLFSDTYNDQRNRQGFRYQFRA